MKTIRVDETIIYARNAQWKGETISENIFFRRAIKKYDEKENLVQWYTINFFKPKHNAYKAYKLNQYEEHFLFILTLMRSTKKRKDSLERVKLYERVNYKLIAHDYVGRLCGKIMKKALREEKFPREEFIRRILFVSRIVLAEQRKDIYSRCVQAWQRRVLFFSSTPSGEARCRN